ncbi:MAG TPA: NAD(P)H-binding protein [Hyphomicrobium sp.]|nr:NAD(P)H-binding protein [Hyphomicrobium sp.]
MRLLLFGATGRTGYHLTSLAAQTGVSVHATGRNLARLATLGSGISCSPVDISDADAVEALVRAVAPKAIISLVGGTLGSNFIDGVGNVAIANAARNAGVRRLVQVSSLGCGESRRHASQKLLAAIGDVLNAKTQAEEHLRSLDLDWTIIRPGGLRDGDPTGGGRLYEDARIHGRITRTDLAGLIFACLIVRNTTHKILSAVDCATLSGPSDPHEYTLM